MQDKPISFVGKKCKKGWWLKVFKNEIDKTFKPTVL